VKALTCRAAVLLVSLGIGLVVSGFFYWLDLRIDFMPATNAEGWVGFVGELQAARTAFNGLQSQLYAGVFARRFIAIAMMAVGAMAAVFGALRIRQSSD
jgi:xanthosine utilization system XapX-like protein